jgi:hypothetical protein
MLVRTLFAGAALAVALPATAAISLVTPGVDGSYVEHQPVLPGTAGNYGVELKGGNNGTNGDWEVGLGKRTSSNPVQFLAGQFAWGAYPNERAFTLTWDASGVSINIGGTLFTDGSFDAPVFGDTFHIYMKRDAMLTIDSIDGQAIGQSWTSVGNPRSDVELYFFSPNAWGGDGFTVTGKLGVKGPGGSANGIQFKVGDFTPNPAVPEPTTWAMLIAGFGLVGAAARRRSGAAPVVAG